MATIKSYRDLVCWQLAVELRRRMIAVTDRPQVRRDLRYCDQVGDSTRSAPANIAEGFKRSNRIFMHYIDIALGSLQETENHVDEALERRYLSVAEHQECRVLAMRAIRAAEELKAYLRRRTAPPGGPIVANRINQRATRRNLTEPDATRRNPVECNLTNPTQPESNLTEPDET